MTNTDDIVYLSSTKAAARLGVTRQTLRNLIDDGEFPNTIRIGSGGSARRDYRIADTDIAAFIARRKVGAGDAAKT